MFSKFERLQPLRIMTKDYARYQLNVIDFEDDGDDEYLDQLIATVGELSEKGTNRLLNRAMVTLEYTYKGKAITLPYGEAQTPTSVQVDGEDVTFVFNDLSEQLSITDATVVTGDTVRVTYVAGYALNGIPTPIVQAAMIMLANFYEHREDLVEVQLSAAPMRSREILASYRIPIKPGVL